MLRSRTPPGVRGLKHFLQVFMKPRGQSHPARGAWIETSLRLLPLFILERRTPPGVCGLKRMLCPQSSSMCSRTPPGVRGLKQQNVVYKTNKGSRTPPGVRGLKPLLRVHSSKHPMSHPTRGAWIETEVEQTLQSQEKGRISRQRYSPIRFNGAFHYRY